MEFFQHTLQNGIRLIHKPVKTQVTHCGLLINAGSRDESEKEMGLAHFIEHTIFKGTKKRKAYHILSRLENIGGDLNAFTSKEETCIYASVLQPYFERAIELFADITQNSVFPPSELVKEKEVIIDEINSYKDNPSEEICDEIEDLVYQGHPLGRNILGTKNSVKALKREDIFNFMTKNYITDEMVICSVGDISMEKAIHIVEKYFGEIPANPRTIQRGIFTGYIPKEIVLNKGMHQAHCMLANEVYGRNHEKRAILILLNNILGGPGLNSRLNMGIREKYGFCYNIESNFNMFTETGILTIYMGTEFDSLSKTISLVMKELKKLRDQKLGSLQLHYAQQQIIGQVALSQESNLNEMMNLGKSILAYNKVDSNESINKKFLSITAEELLDVANEVFAPEKITSLIYTSKS